MAEALAKKEVEKPEEKKKEEPKKKDILGLLLMLLVTLNLAAVAGMGFFMQKLWHHVQEMQGEIQKIATQESEAAKKEKNPMGKELPPKEMGTLYGLESFLVNIGSDQGSKFLQAQMELELSDAAVQDEITRKKPAVRDAVILLLSSRTFNELKDVAGIKKLRTDIIKSINNLLTSGKVKEVYFTQFHFN